MIVGSSRTLWVGIATLALSVFTFYRYREINPAILQDEFVYLISATRTPLWSSSPTYDFGNYLFNVIYSSTAFCGDNFYQCAKGLNVLFFGVFAIFIYLLAEPHLGARWSVVPLVVTWLSPLSVYTSMFLPESLYFAFLGATVYLAYRALEMGSWQMWALAGSMLGLAALAKPHALITLLAFGVFFGVSLVTSAKLWRVWLAGGLAFLGAFLVSRLLFGFLAAGEKALSILGSYGAGGGVTTFVGGLGEATQSSPQFESSDLVGAGPVQGAVGLFLPQLEIHSLTIAALVGFPIALVFASISRRKPANTNQPWLQSFSLFVLIWLGVMIVAIVLFTGWITGSGDDHTTRVLLRYYEFTIPFVAIASVIELQSGSFSNLKWPQRFSFGLAMLLLLTWAYQGTFANLTIQIADAPHLAGLVVSRPVYDIVASLAFLGLVIFIFYPGLLRFVLPATLAITFPLLGWQAGGQYSNFRGEANAQDIVGREMSQTYSPTQLENALLVSDSRFDGRVISFWHHVDNELRVVGSGSYLSAEYFDGYELLVTSGQIEVDASAVLLRTEGDVRIYRVDQ